MDKTNTDPTAKYRKQAADGATLLAGGCALIMIIPLIFLLFFFVLMLLSLVGII